MTAGSSVNRLVYIDACVYISMIMRNDERSENSAGLFVDAQVGKLQVVASEAL